MGALSGDQGEPPPHASFTGRFTAGLRFVESTRVAHPVIAHDPLAGCLAGERGMALAEQELKQLAEAQGPGKHLRVPARSRLIDDILTAEIESLRSRRRRRHLPSAADADAAASHSAGSALAPPPAQAAGATAAGQPPVPVAVGTCTVEAEGEQGEDEEEEAVVCQVVSLGAGMCTRPWRLGALSCCRAIELDLPQVAEAKRAALAEAGAEIVRHDVRSVRQRAEGGPGAVAPCAFPLHAHSYELIGVDLSVPADGGAAGGGGSTLAAALAAHGHDPRVATLWVLEALLYYMPLAAADSLLGQLAAVSAPGSRLVATCVDGELLEASRSGVPKGHVFADLWHFEAEELLHIDNCNNLNRNNRSKRNMNRS
ncbi:hypothetical protein GPECTOR_9g615 [Gonium pectorale]|uniref:Uncharacterized protein n=1 Tax=Gonium pectorale TaxID=33097 RepID=A0A150GRZ9_GONPE|nr:hypothetical protein GPECTOR_9g615 [Gonium pectorale]|eukprot:KXZ52571.1 hypothetical protein GPECTOR_9g615 [Gonium pectorale]